MKYSPPAAVLDPAYSSPVESLGGADPLVGLFLAPKIATLANRTLHTPPPQPHPSSHLT